MKLEKKFTVTLSTGECSEQWSGDEFAPKRFGAEALEEFGAVLRAYGMDVRIDYSTTRKSAELTVRHPLASEAGRLRNRGGGRPKKLVEWPPALGETDAERLAWLDDHSEDEGMAVLGCSRSTYYRRVRALRISVPEN